MDQDVRHGASLFVNRIDDPVPSTFPVAARYEPATVLDDVSRLQFPCLQVHGLPPLPGQVQDLHGLVDVYGLPCGSKFFILHFSLIKCMVESVVEDAPHAVHLEHVVYALRVLVGEGEAWHEAVIVAVVALRVGDDHLLAAVAAGHLSVDDVEHVDHVGAEQLVGPVGHSRRERSRVGLEAARLLDAVVAHHAADARGRPAVAGRHLVRACAVDQLPHAEGVVELQDGRTVGLAEVHVEPLRAPPRADGVGHEQAVIALVVGWAHVELRIYVAASAPCGLERQPRAVAVLCLDRGRVLSVVPEILQPSVRREPGSLQDSQEIACVELLGADAHVGPGEEDACRGRLPAAYGRASRVLQLRLYPEAHHEPLLGVWLQEQSEVGEGDHSAGGPQHLVVYLFVVADHPHAAPVCRAAHADRHVGHAGREVGAAERRKGNRSHVSLSFFGQR